MNVNVVILPFDEVPEEYKIHGSVGGVLKSIWDKAYELSIHGNLILKSRSSDVKDGVFYVQNKENLISFWIHFGCIDLKRTVLCEEILSYLVNYF